MKLKKYSVTSEQELQAQKTAYKLARAFVLMHDQMLVDQINETGTVDLSDERQKEVADFLKDVFSK